MPVATENITDEIVWCVNQLAFLKNQLLTRPFTNLDAARLFDALIRLATAQISAIDGEFAQYDQMVQHFTFIAPAPQRPTSFSPADESQLPKLRQLIASELNCILQLRAYQKEQARYTTTTPLTPPPRPAPANVLERAQAFAIYTNNALLGARGHDVRLCQPSSYKDTMEELVSTNRASPDGINVIATPFGTLLIISAPVGYDLVRRPAFITLLYLFSQNDHPLVDSATKTPDQLKTIIAFARANPLLPTEANAIKVFNQFFERLQPRRAQ